MRAARRSRPAGLPPETALHLALYRTFPRANAVLHGHSPQAVG
ncbi:MAG: class II aldolase/adducin family protein [Sphingomonas sp.]